MSVTDCGRIIDTRRDLQLPDNLGDVLRKMTDEEAAKTCIKEYEAIEQGGLRDGSRDVSSFVGMLRTYAEQREGGRSFEKIMTAAAVEFIFYTVRRTAEAITQELGEEYVVSSWSIVYSVNRDGLCLLQRMHKNYMNGDTVMTLVPLTPE